MLQAPIYIVYKSIFFLTESVVLRCEGFLLVSHILLTHRIVLVVITIANSLWKTCYSLVDGKSVTVHSSSQHLFCTKNTRNEHRRPTGRRQVRNTFSTMLPSGEVRVQFPHGAGEINVLRQRLLDLTAGVQHCRMIAAAEEGADLLQR
jgi:hypothetical protein